MDVKKALDLVFSHRMVVACGGYPLAAIDQPKIFQPFIKARDVSWVDERRNTMG